MGVEWEWKGALGWVEGWSRLSKLDLLFCGGVVWWKVGSCDFYGDEKGEEREERGYVSIAILYLRIAHNIYVTY